MSEFFDAQIVKCPHCGTRFASCEGPECDCMEQREEEAEDAEKTNDSVFNKNLV